jgi:hypothetical protein
MQPEQHRHAGGQCRHRAKQARLARENGTRVSSGSLVDQALQADIRKSTEVHKPQIGARRHSLCQRPRTSQHGGPPSSGVDGLGKRGQTGLHTAQIEAVAQD